MPWASAARAVAALALVLGLAVPVYSHAAAVGEAAIGEAAEYPAEPGAGDSAQVRVLTTSRQSFNPAEQLDAVHITVGRAVDLVGRPLRAVAPPLRKRAPGLGLASLATLGSGMRPSGMPVAAMVMTSGFGMRLHPLLGGYRIHAGIDLAAPIGSPVQATSDGVVASAGWSGGYGNLVTIDHGNGVQTRYGHLSRIAVFPGEPIRRGGLVGYVGSTGLSTGPHLHYEIRQNGMPLNPAGTLSGH